MNLSLRIATAARLVLLAILILAGTRSSATSAAGLAGSHPQAIQNVQPERPSTGSDSVLFIENVGQFGSAAEKVEGPDTGLRFEVHGSAGTMFLTPDALWITLLNPAAPPPMSPSLTEPSTQLGNTEPLGVNLRFSFVDANSQPEVIGVNRLDVTLSYFRGTEEHWRPRVPVYGAARYVDLYPGVDLLVAGDGGQVRMDLQVHDSAQASHVRLRIEGAEQLRVDADRLVLTTAVGELALPVSGFNADSVELATPKSLGRNTLRSSATPHIEVRTPSSPNTVDTPAGFRSTFLGGSSTDYGTSIASMEDYVYVTGSTFSADFPSTPGPFERHVGNYDVFVSKFDSELSSLQFGIILGADASGGNVNDQGRAITVNRELVYVVGRTEGPGFPVTKESAFQYNYNLGQSNYPWGDAFLTIVDSGGTELMYSTYLGGGDAEEGNGVALDPETGKVYVVGATNSDNGIWRFPTTRGAYDRRLNNGMTACGYYQPSDGFVSVFDPARTGPNSLVYSTFLGGAGCDAVRGVGLNSDNMVYVTGRTTSTNFPIQSPVQEDNHGNTDGFVTVLDTHAGVEGLVYSTYFGGSDQDQVTALAVDKEGHAYVMGYTFSVDLPITDEAFQKEASPLGDLFVSELAPTPGMDGPIYCTYLGGSSYDGLWDTALQAAYAGNAIAVDERGYAYIVGYSMSSDYPTTDLAFQRHVAGAQDVVVSVLNEDGSGLEYSTYVGGTDRDFGFAITLGGDGKIYITGKTESTDFPVSHGAYQGGYTHGSSDAFITALSDCSVTGDTDGDALLDRWETCGYRDPQTGGYVDLPAMGASPLHRDVFVEIDYMVRYPGGYISFQPPPEAFIPVVTAFAESGTPNPDGSRGIRLHVDNGELSLMNPATGDRWGEFSQASEITYESPVVPCKGDPFASGVFDQHFKNVYFAPERKPIFHYGVFVDRIDGCLPYPDVSGWARQINYGGVLAGDDFVVGLGFLGEAPARLQAFAMMHEVGHDLGLSDGPQPMLPLDQPNYLSVLNAKFGATLGIPYSANPYGPGRLDYSHWDLPDLDETALSETVGLNTTLATGYGTLYPLPALPPGVTEPPCLHIPHWFPGKPDLGLAQYTDRWIDWNCNGIVDPFTYAQDLDNSGEYNILRSAEDWLRLRYWGGDVGDPDGLADAAGTMPYVSGDAFPRPYVGYLLAFDGVREITDLPGRTALNTLTLYNKGYLTSTVTLSLSSLRGWFKLPQGERTFVLPPGASVAVPVQYTLPAATAGAPSEDAAFISATIHELPGMPETTLWTVRIGPRVDFAADMRVSSDRTVVFADRSEGAITSWLWDFGDGTTSTAQSPQHNYAAPGRYVVRLTVTAPYGTSTTSRIVSVEEK